MMRIRIDGGGAHQRAAARRRRHLDRRTAATSPTSATGRTSSCTGSGSRTSRRSGQKLEAVGLSTTEACGDTPRVMLGCPLEGVAADSVIDAGPRRCARPSRSTSATRRSRTCRASSRPRSPAARGTAPTTRSTTSPSSASSAPDGTAGYRPLGRRRPVDEPDVRQAARRVRRVPTRCSDVWAGVTSVFRDYGYRRQRNHARLKFLVADWGVEKFREVLENEYLQAGRSRTGRRRRVLRRTATTPASSRRTTACSASARRRKSGRTSGTALRRGRRDRRPVTARAAIALTAQQGVVVLDVARAETGTVADELAAIDLIVHPSAFQRGTIACTGIEFCKLALVETKGRAESIRAELEQRLPDFDTPITMQRQRLPELVRPLPGRRHRPQGHGAEGRRRRRGRVPGAPRRADGHRRRVRAEVPRPEGDGCSKHRTTSSACCVGSSIAARTVSHSRRTCRGPRRHG